MNISELIGSLNNFRPPEVQRLTALELINCTSDLLYVLIHGHIYTLHALITYFAYPKRNNKATKVMQQKINKQRRLPPPRQIV
jgi:hypothetical protein